MNDDPILTPSEVRAIREQLGWTLEEAGHMMGFTGKYVRQAWHQFESGRRTLSYTQAHLLLAFRAGYRPASPLIYHTVGESNPKVGV
jgi:transcriptional regulator with XRE-family HTH domain